MNSKGVYMFFVALSVLLFGAMCAVVGYTYADIQCAIEHGGTSAPAWVAFFYGIPFAIVILICVIIAAVFHRKSKKVAYESHFFFFKGGKPA